MFTNRRTVRIEWGDCDPAEIVFYPRYFAFFDASTQALFEAAGFPKYEMRKRFGVVGYPMLETSSRFMIPSRFGEDIVIETTISDFGRSSFAIRHRVLKGEAVAIEASEKRAMVHVDPATGKLKSCPIPAEMLAAFTARANT